MTDDYDKKLNILYQQLQQTHSTIAQLQQRLTVQETLASNILSHIRDVQRVRSVYSARYNHYTTVTSIFERDFDSNFNSLISRERAIQRSIPVPVLRDNNYTACALDWELYENEVHDNFVFQLERHHFWETYAQIPPDPNDFEQNDDA